MNDISVHEQFNEFHTGFSIFGIFANDFFEQSEHLISFILLLKTQQSISNYLIQLNRLE